MSDNAEHQGRDLYLGQTRPAAGKLAISTPAADLIITKLSERVARDMSAAITALEGCRPLAKSPQALTALNNTIDRLQQASCVQFLLACPGPGEVCLDESVYALAVGMRRSQPTQRPVQLTFELEPARASNSVARVVLLFLAEVMSGLMTGATTGDVTIGVRLSFSGGVLELGVRLAGSAIRVSSFELAPDMITLAGAMGAQIGQRLASMVTEWQIGIQLDDG